VTPATKKPPSRVIAPPSGLEYIENLDRWVGLKFKPGTRVCLCPPFSSHAYVFSLSSLTSNYLLFIVECADDDFINKVLVAPSCKTPFNIRVSFWLPISRAEYHTSSLLARLTSISTSRPPRPYIIAAATCAVNGRLKYCFRPWRTNGPVQVGPLSTLRLYVI